jgi:hypothetical protein
VHDSFNGNGNDPIDAEYRGSVALFSKIGTVAYATQAARKTFIEQKRKEILFVSTLTFGRAYVFNLKLFLQQYVNKCCSIVRRFL